MTNKQINAVFIKMRHSVEDDLIIVDMLDGAKKLIVLNGTKRAIKVVPADEINVVSDYIHDALSEIHELSERKTLDMAVVLEYCYKLSMCVVPEAANRLYGLQHGGDITSFIGDLALALRHGNTLDLTDEFYSKAYSTICKGGTTE